MTHSTHLRRAIWLTTGLTFSLAIGASQRASAQAVDPSASPKMPPNVLLIVDTSGSMEYRAGLDTYPICDPAGSPASQRSRWVDLVEVLSGEITNYRCQEIDRASTTFTGLYRLPGLLNPPDYNYRNPYHRPLSGTCAPTPNITAEAALTNAFGFAPPSYALYNASATACAFAQAGDGLIDSFTGSIRFGLMTFDTLPDDSNGFVAATNAAFYSDGIEGAWSYFRTAAAAGRPQSCATSTPLEVGARNGAAPMWEGKMIAFGKPTASTSENTTRHTRIENVLLSTRPYGATPIAGAMTDAQTFLTLDVQPDPTPVGDPLHTTYYGPKNDPFVQNGCRDQFVVLLTDGEPNLDLRPFCEAPTPAATTCPYERPETVATQLKALNGSGGLSSIKTFVVGFAAESAPAPDSTDCTTMVATDWAPGGKCDTPATDELRVCCTLHEIAAEGGTGKAYFGSNKAALRTALSDVFSVILAGGGSATQPVRSPGVGDAQDAGTIAFRMLTSYETGSTGVWRGTVERLRWGCGATGLPAEIKKDATLGDDFSFNVNSHPTSRTFMTYVPTAVSGTIYSDRSIRPNIADGTVDAVGKNAGPASTAAVVGAPAAFVSGVDPLALRPDLLSGPCTGLATATACKDRLLTWFVGLNNSTGNHRCQNAATSPTDPACSVIGDVMHSTPVIVDHPTAEIEDEPYIAYRFGDAANRPMMVYTSSNDGVVHGFKLSPNVAADPDVDNTNSNETFAFVPPAILSLVDSQYPKSRQKLLDGVPIVQEVVATVDATNAYYGFRLQRGSADAAVASTNLTYRTVLVQSFGGAQSGYFAMDITDPTSTDPAKRPRMLWQLTTDSVGAPLFGEQGATPLITTLNVGGYETAVAVLPGGHATPVTGYCPRIDNTHPQIPSAYAPRWNVRCYPYDQDNDGSVEAGDSVTYIGARSLTIVRLDSGEVITRFRRSLTGEGLALPSGRVNLATLDSPITGTPAAYPMGTGTVADRIFVGDQDGTMWRIDTSSSNPANWTMELFFDAFSKHPDVGSPALASAAGRPIVVAPTLSVDSFGQITVATATGDQDLSGALSEKHYVWSLREKFNSTTSAYNTVVNWYQPLDNGEHVLGPIRLNEGVLYFSTFKPEVGVSCSSGTSTIFGVDYIKEKDSSLIGGYGRLSLSSSAVVPALADRVTAAELGLPIGTIIFGVALEYVPTCFSESIPAAAFLGGSHLSATNSSASALQLAFQTGKGIPAKAGLGFKTGFQTVGLNRPTSGATIESWAAILE